MNQIETLTKRRDVLENAIFILKMKDNWTNYDFELTEKWEAELKTTSEEIGQLATECENLKNERWKLLQKEQRDEADWKRVDEINARLVEIGTLSKEN